MESPLPTLRYQTFQQQSETPLPDEYSYFSPPTSFDPQFEKNDPFEAAMMTKKVPQLTLPPGFRENFEKNICVYQDRRIVCVSASCHACLYLWEFLMCIFSLFLLSTAVASCVMTEYCAHASGSCALLIPFLLILCLLSMIFQIILSFSISTVFRNEEREVDIVYKYQILFGCVEIPFWKITMKYKQVKDFILRKSFWMHYGKMYNVYLAVDDGSFFKISDTKELKQQRGLIRFLKELVEDDEKQKKSSFFQHER